VKKIKSRLIEQLWLIGKVAISGFHVSSDPTCQSLLSPLFLAELAYASEGPDGWQRRATTNMPKWHASDVDLGHGRGCPWEHALADHAAEHLDGGGMVAVPRRRCAPA
jgi:hypothetical protein